MNESELHSAEAKFHDAWATSEDIAKIQVRPAFESPVAMENAYLLRELGDLKGKRILDVGAGLGESSVYFALQGAHVTTIDLSSEMVALAKSLAKRHGVEIQGLVGSAEQLPVARGSYDIVYAANILHHIQDKDAFLKRVSDALVPGGKFAAFDPLRYNPVINVYRWMATKVRTEDEMPLGFEFLDQLKRYFGKVNHAEFWLLSLSLFLKYFLIDRVHPNEDRYWKRIFRETDATLWWWRPLRAMDRVLTRLPIANRFAWNMAVTATKA